MGKVSATVEVKPEGPDVDLDSLLDDVEKSLPKGAKITDSQTEPIGFGVSKLLVQVTIPDREGGTEAVEKAFSDIDGVQSVDTGNVTRL